jgi:chromosomal replication initiation ATPase DnaA
VLRLARLVARERRVSLLTLVSGSRGTTDATMARHLAFYLSYVLLGRTYEEVGLLFARSRNTIQRSCRIIEELREDPLVDREISKLEQNMNIAKERPDAD